MINWYEKHRFIIQICVFRNESRTLHLLLSGFFRDYYLNFKLKAYAGDVLNQISIFNLMMKNKFNLIG